jgi:hypothetical protein
VRLGGAHQAAHDAVAGGGEVGGAWAVRGEHSDQWCTAQPGRAGHDPGAGTPPPTHPPLEGLPQHRFQVGRPQQDLAVLVVLLEDLGGRGAGGGGLGARARPGALEASRGARPHRCAAAPPRNRRGAPPARAPWPRRCS